jgi:type VI secretion system protein ImpF
MSKRQILDQSMIQAGALAPLFDRLSDLEPHLMSEPSSYQILGPSELRESVQRELEMILNTRPTVRRPPEDGHGEFISDFALPQFFGLRDFSWFDGASDLGRRTIGTEIERVVAYYEPRLKNVKALVSKHPIDPLSLIAEIAGDLKIGKVLERFTFPITIQNLLQRDEN